MPTPIKTAQEHQAAPVEKVNAQEVAVEQSPEQTPLRLTTRAFIQAGAGSETPHPNLRHLPASQRPNLARRISQVHSNGLLQRLLRRAPVNLGGMTATSCGEAASAIALLVLQLRGEMPGVPEGEEVHTNARNAVTEGELRVSQLNGQADQDIDDTMSTQLTGWYADYNSARDAIDSFQKARAAEQITQAVAQATALENQADTARDQFDFPMEQAFRQNDTERLTRLSNGITALATAKSATSTLKQALMQAYSLVLTPGIKAVALVPEIKPVYDQIKKVGAAYTVAMGVISLISGGEGNTQAEQEINNISTVLSTTTSVATLLGVASGYMVCIGAIIPVGTALLGLVSRILGREGRRLNQLALQEMDLDGVAWEYVPGGRACFEYMVAVMRAGGPEGVPLPMHSQVSSYFVSHRDQLGAGTGSEVPTTGYWFWRDIDDTKIKRWVYQNRRNLWSMFYGEVRPVGVPF
ncbi:MAG: hypothetical protein ACYCZF_09945 [Anaerolineae bacterium]